MAEAFGATFTAAIHLVGRSGRSSVIEALAACGHYAVSGAIGAPIVEMGLRTIHPNELAIHGCTLTPRAVFAERVDLIDRGPLPPSIARTYPMADIVRAQQDFPDKSTPGKLVLSPPR